MTKECLESIVSKLFNVDYTVISCVSDCGGGNVSLPKILNISAEQTYFSHPITNENIYKLADASLLLKLMRNWLIDTGFILERDTAVNKIPLVDLFSTECDICHTTVIPYSSDCIKALSNRRWKIQIYLNTLQISSN